MTQLSHLLFRQAKNSWKQGPGFRHADSIASVSIHGTAAKVIKNLNRTASKKKPPQYQIDFSEVVFICFNKKDPALWAYMKFHEQLCKALELDAHRWNGGLLLLHSFKNSMHWFFLRDRYIFVNNCYPCYDDVLFKCSVRDKVRERESEKDFKRKRD